MKNFFRSLLDPCTYFHKWITTWESYEPIKNGKRVCSRCGKAQWVRVQGGITYKDDAWF